MTKHKTITVTFNEISEEIDEKIAPLIKSLWELGINTFNSCENNVPEGWVWIEFESASHAEEFLNIVAEYNEDRNSLYNRIRQAWDSDDDSLFWQYSVHANDWGVSETLDEEENLEEEFLGQSAFIFSFSIRFPQSDLEEIMNKLNFFTRK
jgi:hypothetical protein